VVHRARRQAKRNRHTTPEVASDALPICPPNTRDKLRGARPCATPHDDSATAERTDYHAPPQLQPRLGSFIALFGRGYFFAKSASRALASASVGDAMIWRS